jgi:hypothetical protein
MSAPPSSPAPIAVTTPRPSPIPPFTSSGVLPPFVGLDPTQFAGRAPYLTGLLDLVDRFATSAARKEILEGYLDHRDKLLNLGFTGHQWLDGSFMEDIETTAGRDPSDIDVISFITPPPHLIGNVLQLRGLTLTNPNVFIARLSKQTYKTEAYFVSAYLDSRSLISQTAYWFGLFSHRKTDSVWKGLLEVPLQPALTSVDARALLRSK